MSKHTNEYLHRNMRVGFGHRAWWYKEAIEKALSIASHYAGAVPLAEVRRLFDTVKPVRSSVTHTYTDSEGNTQVVRDTRNAGVVNSVDGSIFGTFSNGSEWRSFSEDLLDNIRDLTSGSVDIGSCGLLDFGARAFLSLEIPETLHNDKTGISYRPRLLAATALDGSLATTYKRVNILPVCDNTLAIGLAENGETVKVKHTKNSGLRLATAAETLAILSTTADEIDSELVALVETPFTDEQFDAFLNEICPVTADSSKHAVTHAEKRRDAYLALWRNDNRVSPWRGTLFGALQADNTYRQHVAIRRGAGEDGDRDAMRAERNMTDVLTGKSMEADKATMVTLRRVLTTV